MIAYMGADLDNTFAWPKVPFEPLGPNPNKYIKPPDVAVVPTPAGGIPEQIEHPDPAWKTYAKNITLAGGALIVVATLLRGLLKK